MNELHTSFPLLFEEVLASSIRAIPYVVFFLISRTLLGGSF